MLEQKGSYVVRQVLLLVPDGKCRVWKIGQVNLEMPYVSIPSVLPNSYSLLVMLYFGLVIYISELEHHTIRSQAVVERSQFSEIRTN